MKKKFEPQVLYIYMGRNGLIMKKRVKIKEIVFMVILILVFLYMFYSVSRVVIISSELSTKIAMLAIAAAIYTIFILYMMLKMRENGKTQKK